MIRDIEERLNRMDLVKSPFLHYDPGNPEFEQVFVNRVKELYKIKLAMEYYKSHSNRNLALIGPPRIGKTTLLQYTVSCIDTRFRYLYLDYPLRFNEFCEKGIAFFNPDKTISRTQNDSRELGNQFIENSGGASKDSIIIIDNFEEMLQIPDEEVRGFIRLFRRSKNLFLIACTENEWSILIEKYQGLKYAFVEEIFIHPFTMENCFELISTRINIARKPGTTGIHPFTDEAVRTIGLYSLFIPGRIYDLANKLLFEALTENLSLITLEFTRSIVLQAPAIGKRIAGLNEKEIMTFEIMMETNAPMNFEELSTRLDVSKVAVAGYIQKLIDHTIVVQLDTPGKKKFFQITDNFKSILI